MRRLLFTFFIFNFSFLISWAAPAKPGLLQIEQEDGSVIEGYLYGDENHHFLTDASGNMLKLNALGKYEVASREDVKTLRNAKMTTPPKQIRRVQRRVGELNMAQRGLVILVNFSDKNFTYTHEQLDSMMNAQHYDFQGATGSAKQYFTDQSNGLYVPQFDVIGPVTLNNNTKYYGENDASDNDKRPEQMIQEACQLADSQYGVDFSLYDNDNDGFVDFVYVFYAGKGESDGGGDNTVWPHSWELWYGAGIRCTLDGKKINSYACSAELDGGTGNRLTGIGVVCHEFSHVLGLPDYYDTEYGANYNNWITPNNWSLMDGGCYLNNSKTPPNYSAHDKYYLGWAEPTRLTEPTNVQIPADGQTYFALTAGFMGATSTSTIYYLENRQQTGWDAYLPGHGMMITKVMYNEMEWYNNTPNNTDLRYEVIRADGYKRKSAGSPTDLFPGAAGHTSYEPISGYALTDIEEVQGYIQLRFMGGTEDPFPEIPTSIASTESIDKYLIIYDLLGREVARGEFEQARATVPCTGLYILMAGTERKKVYIVK